MSLTSQSDVADYLLLYYRDLLTQVTTHQAMLNAIIPVATEFIIIVIAHCTDAI